jgi:hypothetical protein|tara:strand:- start:1065 stop:1235 length:171 start_codon:yes stop_codon:yes gene_type:complete
LVKLQLEQLVKHVNVVHEVGEFFRELGKRVRHNGGVVGFASRDKIQLLFQLLSRSG